MPAPGGAQESGIPRSGNETSRREFRPTCEGRPLPRWVALLAVGSRGGVGPSRVKLTIRRVAVFASRAGQQACGGIGAGPDAQASRGNLTGSGGVWAFGYDAAHP